MLLRFVAPSVRPWAVYLGGLALACPVAAQTPQGPETGAEGKTLERIAVTGSRIKRIDTETSQPVTLLTREAIQSQGLTSIAEVLQHLSISGSASNGLTNQGGTGEARLSLRSLGSRRTLILVNGRRWVGSTSLDGPVDLNSIPAAAIERVEVLKDGASVIYGSDAMAGVVNIILRKDFEGLELDSYAGAYGQGDGQRKAVDLLWGHSGEGYRGMVGLGYVQEDALGAGDRAISSEPKAGTGVALGSTTTPFGRFRVCNGVWSGGACSGTQTRPDGSAGQFTYSPGQSGLGWRSFDSPADLYNVAPSLYLRTPQERLSLFGSGSVELGGGTRLNLMAALNRRTSQQRFAAVPLLLGASGGEESADIVISRDSLYNPFGQEVTAIQRRVLEAGPRYTRQTVTTLAATAELEGTVSWASQPYAWTAGLTLGRNRLTERSTGNFGLEALRSGLGPSMRDATGRAICVGVPGDARSVIPGCVPINLLGAPGSVTPEMLNYGLVNLRSERGYSVAQLYAGLSGDLIQLPAGPLRFAAGLEHRMESGFDRPDPLSQAGLTTEGSSTATSGRDQVTEAYAELAVPVLKNLPAAKALDLSLGARYSHYSNFGSTTNAKAGVTWRINDAVMLRGSWSQGFRAPSVVELYKGPSQSYETVPDACSTTYGGFYADLTPEAQARCHAQGVPVGGYAQDAEQIRTTGGGNQGLKPETSVSETLGVVLSPSFIPGLDVSLDWWNIAIKNVISYMPGWQIIDQCIEKADDSACALYSRGPGGQVTRLYSGLLNFGSLEAQGLDLALNYRLPRTRLGTFALSWDTTLLRRYEWDGDGNNLVGRYETDANHWRLRSNLGLSWRQGDFGGNWNLRYFSAQKEDCRLPAGYTQLCSDPDNRQNVLGATTYHDVSVWWRTPWKGRVTLGVNNLLGRQPPTSYSASSNSFDGQYEIPGRFVYLRYSQRF